ncbi:hypothetical protein CDL15_Pgr023949 [Punica granatum]|uniref:Uncharacterized protein n=1 Tax=Punica granatum TaxID=22663 RepID=A0A218WUZ6_PUNGR|nr:hypothetical protein CDL15_Pgr023949 [Punica granatum]
MDGSKEGGGEDEESVREVLRDRLRLSSISLAQSQGKPHLPSADCSPNKSASSSSVSDSSLVLGKWLFVDVSFQRFEMAWKFPNQSWPALPTYPSNMQVIEALPGFIGFIDFAMTRCRRLWCQNVHSELLTLHLLLLRIINSVTNSLLTQYEYFEFFRLFLRIICVIILEVRYVEQFARHAGRKYVNMEDVILSAHRNEQLARSLRSFSNGIKVKEPQSEKKRKKTSSRKEEKAAPSTIHVLDL